MHVFSYHAYSFRETDINARIYVKSLQSHWSVKCRSRASDHSACLKGILRTITMEGLTLAAIIAAEKQTLLRHKIMKKSLECEKSIEGTGS